MDPRLARTRPEPERPYAPGESEFRTDLERIRFGQSFSRLAEVTQVVNAAATSGVVHNRLTHTIKVTAVARAIAVRLLRTEDRNLLRDLGGLDHVVVQAAANAHDLGHPPFGHLGERILDRLARDRFGLADGFESNPDLPDRRSWRSRSRARGAQPHGAGRAAVPKYPWARFPYLDHPTTGRYRRAGLARGAARVPPNSRPT
jgi:dGTPase